MGNTYVHELTIDHQMNDQHQSLPIKRTQHDWTLARRPQLSGQIT
jgi:hypothetical protein